MTKLFLTGYEKETLNGFLYKLKKVKITAVIDIRETPLSRKNGFSKNQLKKILSSRGIKYYHFSKLGSPRKLRKKLNKTGDYLVFFKDYRNYIKKNKSLIKDVTRVISCEKRATLLCFEKASELCHRPIVTSEILKINSKMMVIQI